MSADEDRYPGPAAGPTAGRASGPTTEQPGQPAPELASGRASGPAPGPTTEQAGRPAPELASGPAPELASGPTEGRASGLSQDAASGLTEDAAEVVARAQRRQWRERAWSSRVLHRLGQLSSHAGAGLVVAAVVVGWLVVGLLIDFPGWWENALYITSSLTTLIMVFAVQHTQARQSAATQRKLDELLRAVPAADNQLIALEEVSEQQLQHLNHRNIIDRETAPPRAGTPAGAAGPGGRRT